MPRRKFKVVVVCGSMRFYDQMIAAAQELSLMGYVVLMPFVRFSGDAQRSDAKAMLDDMHRQKIDMAHHVVVVTDADTYIGESTGSEIRYAQSKGKPTFVWTGGTFPYLPEGSKLAKKIGREL